MDCEMNERVRQQIAASISVKQEILASQSFIDKLVDSLGWSWLMRQT